MLLVDIVQADARNVLAQQHAWPDQQFVEMLVDDAARVRCFATLPKELDADEAELTRSRKLRRASRHASASPAAGSHTTHESEQKKLLAAIFG